MHLWMCSLPSLKANPFGFCGENQSKINTLLGTDRQTDAQESRCGASRLVRSWTDCNYNSYCHSHYCEREAASGWTCMRSVSRALMRLFAITASQCGDVTHLTCAISPLWRVGGGQNKQELTLLDKLLQTIIHNCLSKVCQSQKTKYLLSAD